MRGGIYDRTHRLLHLFLVLMFGFGISFDRYLAYDSVAQIHVSHDILDSCALLSEVITEVCREDRLAEIPVTL